VYAGSLSSASSPSGTSGASEEATGKILVSKNKKETGTLAPPLGRVLSGMQKKERTRRTIYFASISGNLDRSFPDRWEADESHHEKLTG